MTGRASVCVLVSITALASARVAAAAEIRDFAATSGQGDRLILSGDWVSWTGPERGSGEAVAWVGVVAPNARATFGADHHSLAGASWAYGSLGGAYTFATARGPQLTLAADVHEGSGTLDGRSFQYSYEHASASRPIGDNLTLQVEDGQWDVDTTHVNIPKVSAIWLFARRCLVSAGYAHSAGGNADVQLTSLRVDYQGSRGSLLAGAATGRTTPIVLNLPSGAQLPGGQLREVFGGFSKSMGRTEILLVGDYIKLEGATRLSITAAITLHLGRASP